MRFSLLLAGFIFLFSPDISHLDLLPDFIGWLLIAFGLVRLADIEYRLDDVRRISIKMVLISLVKAFLSLFTFRFGSSDLLLATFAYGIVEVIVVFPFVKGLFAGLDYSSMRVGSTIDSEKNNMAKSYLYTFFIVKNVLSVLPATVALFDSRVTGEYSADTWFINYDSAMRMLMVLSFFIAVILSIVMLSFFIPYWKKLIKNSDLNTKMLSHWQESVLSVPSKMLRKKTGTVLSVLAVSLLFFFDFYVDGTDVLPTFVGFVGVMIASIYIERNMSFGAKKMLVVSTLGAVISLFALLYKLVPLIKSKFVIDYAFSSNTFTIPISIALFIATLLTFIFVFSFLGTLNKEYTKYKLEDNLLLYEIGGAIVAIFNFALYVFPNYNTTFVFPSLIFGIAFTALGINYTLKLKKQIFNDNKE